MTNAPKILYGNLSEQINYLTSNQIISSSTQITTQQELNDLINQLTTKQNLLYLKLEKDKSKISIEQIQNLIDFSQQKPHLSSVAAAIIDDAQTMSEQAQNKLLKLLEEPPYYLHIFILINSNKAGLDVLLKTVLSRCQLIDLRKEPGKNFKDKSDQELVHLAKQFFGMDSEIKLAYLKTKDLLKQTKTPGEGKQLLTTLINYCSQYNKQLLNELTSSTALKSQSTLQLELQTIDYRDKLFSEMTNALKANVNKKLILNRLFIELI